MTGWPGVDWSLAPSWATHWAVDGNGCAHWLGHEYIEMSDDDPDRAHSVTDWYWLHRCKVAPTFGYTGRPQDSLTVRPAQKDATP